MGKSNSYMLKRLEKQSQKKWKWDKRLQRMKSEVFWFQDLHEEENRQ